ncbi:MAG: CocE/NonD family hydrolase C-terminal non-catalytic domain-containing protein, partial [Bacteroidota bacterium]
TPVLDEPMHISGEPSITIRVAADQPAVNLSVLLVSLPWVEGRRSSRGGVVTRSWADPQNATSLTESTPLTPGEFVDLTFPLQPDDQIIAAGQQLGLVIFSSDRDYTLWPDPGTVLTVDLDATSLTLPIVSGN